MGEDEGFMLIDEVAALCRASPETVRFWIKTGRLRSVRPGRRRLIARAELRRFLETASPSRRRAPSKAEGDGS